jgi:mono/diheme cytochrome c family protein
VIRLLGAILLAGAAGAWFVTGGQRLSADDLSAAAGDGDAAAGEQVFWAAGCASCHAAPEAEGDALLTLAGGQRFPSDFGTFVAPNISTDQQVGIGGWSFQDFATALRNGVSPQGRHYYPAFPYPSYAHMTDADIADLWAFMRMLPADQTPSAGHELSFPFSIRRSVAVWKWMNLDDEFVLGAADTESLARGRYLVEALSHCAECHTPRNAFGGLVKGRWMGGAPNPSGKGSIPNITPGALDWSATDIAYYLGTGFTPDYDSAGGHMARVVQNLARLPDGDRQAIAAYLKALPPVAPLNGGG